MQTPNKQELRTRDTKARLLQAAEELLIRDGYDGTQMDEIAARAGKSKGAVYAHYKSKEELFLALFELRTIAYIGDLMESLRECASRSESLKAFRTFFLGLVKERAWPILMLEFKLFSLRHPESKERFARLFAMIRTAYEQETYVKMFGPQKSKKKAEYDLALTALGPIISGMVLETYFEPQLLDGKGLNRILGRLFDALFPAEQ